MLLQDRADRAGDFPGGRAFEDKEGDSLPADARRDRIGRLGMDLQGRGGIVQVDVEPDAVGVRIGNAGSPARPGCLVGAISIRDAERARVYLPLGGKLGELRVVLL